MKKNISQTAKCPVSRPRHIWLWEKKKKKKGGGFLKFVVVCGKKKTKSGLYSVPIFLKHTAKIHKTEKENKKKKFGNPKSYESFLYISAPCILFQVEKELAYLLLFLLKNFRDCSYRWLEATQSPKRKIPKFVSSSLTAYRFSFLIGCGKRMAGFCVCVLFDVSGPVWKTLRYRYGIMCLMAWTL